METITLKVTIDEANLLLEALGEMPFKRVYGLVGKIQQQASAQLGSDGQLTRQEETGEMKKFSREEEQPKEE